MKSIYETFTDAEHQRLVKAKKKTTRTSWHDFIMTLSKGVSCKKNLKVKSMKGGNKDEN